MVCIKCLLRLRELATRVARRGTDAACRSDQCDAGCSGTDNRSQQEAGVVDLSSTKRLARRSWRLEEAEEAGELRVDERTGGFLGAPWTVLEPPPAEDCRGIPCLDREHQRPGGEGATLSSVSFREGRQGSHARLSQVETRAPSLSWDLLGCACPALAAFSQLGICTSTAIGNLLMNAEGHLLVLLQYNSKYHTQVRLQRSIPPRRPKPLAPLGASRSGQRSEQSTTSTPPPPHHPYVSASIAALGNRSTDLRSRLSSK